MSTQVKTIIDAYVAAAVAEIGVVEEPRGSNRGPRVEAYLAATGLPGGNPWCAALLAWVGKTTSRAGGWTYPLPRTASCDVLLDFARRRDLLRPTPEPGDLFLVRASETDATHVGVVRDRSDGGAAFRTVEGNSNAGGSREGYAVVSLVRTVARPGRLPMTFVRWAPLVPEAAEKAPWEVWLEPGGSAGEGGPTHLGAASLSGGSAYFPARGLLSALFGAGATAADLVYDAADNSLVWRGRVVPAEVVLREGSAWVQVRPLAAFLGLSLSVSDASRVILLGRPKAL